MADAYETKIKVSADTSDAQRKLSDLGNQKIKPVEVTVAINDADVKAKLARIAAENKIKVSPAGVSEKDGEKFKIEFLPDDKNVKRALREVTASKHTVIVGMRAQWETAKSLHEELRKPLPPSATPPPSATTASTMPPPPPRIPPPSTPTSAEPQERKSAEEARKLVAALNDAGDASDSSGKKADGAYKKVTGSINKAYYSLRAFQRLAAGMGLVSALLMVVRGIGNLSKSFLYAKRLKEEFFAIESGNAAERQVNSLANSYNALADAIKSAAEEQKHLLGLIDDGVKSRRANERADIGEAERRELAGLDPNSPTYAQDAERIRSRFSQMRGMKDASDKVEDLVLQRQKMGADATAAEGEATAQDAKTKEIRARIDKAKRERGAAEVRAVEMNDEDNTGVAARWGANVRSLVTLRWGQFNNENSEAGDAIRKEAAREAAQKDLEVQKLEEELRKSEHAAAELRKKAARIRERADAMGGLVEAAQKNADTVAASNASATQTADARRDAEDRRRAERLDADLAKSSASAQWNREYDASTTAGRRAMLAESRKMAEQELADKRSQYQKELNRPAAERDASLLSRLEAEIKSAAALVETRAGQQNQNAISGARRLEGELDKAYSSGQVSGNRLTAMGLGSGVRGTDTLATDMHKMLDLMREQIKATKDNKPTDGTSTATFSE